ncbi:MAG TPA: ABC transporter permease [Firmicutes bacterium]|nr:ABC transporter permease [Bacillota bacterium]
MKNLQFRNILLILHKEVIDMLRDKRTIIGMIVVPIVVMPLLSLGIMGLMMAEMKKLEEKPIILGLCDNSRTNLVKPAFEDPDQNGNSLNIKFFETQDEEVLRQKVISKEIMIGIIIPENLENNLQTNTSAELILVYDKSRPQTDAVMPKVLNIIRNLGNSIRDERLKGIGLTEEFIHPIKIKYEDLATPKKMGAFIIGMILPYMLLILSVAGASNPAMDLTAGEKERGTLETILVSPASIEEITFGKFFTIQLASIISTLLILLSYFIFLKIGLFASMADIYLKINIPFTALILILLLFIPVSGMFSALLLTLSIFAKSLKEAQSYMAPIMVLTIFPAMISLLPGIESSVILSIIPVVNVSLSIKMIITEDFNLMMYLLTFLSSTLYAIICLLITINIFKRESVLFRI